MREPAAWKCGRCGQANSSWAKEFGRCPPEPDALIRACEERDAALARIRELEHLGKTPCLAWEALQRERRRVREMEEGREGFVRDTVNAATAACAARIAELEATIGRIRIEAQGLIEQPDSCMSDAIGGHLLRLLEGGDG